MADSMGSHWRRVSDELPAVGSSVLVWIEFLVDGVWGHGIIDLVDVRSECNVYDVDENDVSTARRITDFHFHWAGGDNDHQWPQSDSFVGSGGYGWEKPNRVSFWHSLPEPPK